jgi:hypothetical protein
MFILLLSFIICALVVLFLLYAEPRLFIFQLLDKVFGRKY